MATSLDSNNPLSRLMEEPLIEIGLDISNMVECAEKIRLLEDLAIKFPNVDTYTAKIKRANDFQALLDAVNKTKLEIQLLYQKIKEQLKEKQKNYAKLDEEYEKLYDKLKTNVLASSKQIIRVGEAYLEKAYADKFQELVSKIDNIIHFIKEEIKTLETKVKDIKNEIKKLDIGIAEDTKELIKIINSLYHKNNITPNIEKEKLDIPIYNEEGKKIIEAAENEKTFPCEVHIDKTQVIHAFRNFMKEEINEKVFNMNNVKEKLNNFINKAITNQVINGVKFIEKAEKNISSVLSDMPEIDRIAQKYALNIIDEKKAEYSVVLDKLKIIESKNQRKENLIQTEKIYTEQINIYNSHLNNLNAHLKELPVKDIGTNTLDALQKIMDQALSIKLKEPKTIESAQIKAAANPTKETTLEEPPPTKTTRPGRI